MKKGSMWLEYRTIGNRAQYETGEAVRTGRCRAYKVFGLYAKSIKKQLEGFKTRSWIHLTMIQD